MGKFLIAALVVLLGLFAAWYSMIRINPNALTPKVITQPSRYDTDDPAIWVNEENPDESLILGTDKDEDGALYVYDLNGNIIEDKVVRGLKRPNNVDLEKFTFDNGDEIHIAVVTERLSNKLRIFSVPAMTPVDNGGIEVFVGEKEREPMGIALYKRQSDDAVFAIVSRKTGPSDGYLWQYRLTGNSDGTISGQKVRAFGKFSGKAEIEAIAADNEHGYLYYSDENEGIRKYHADPDKGDEQLAIFGTSGFASDREGISIYEIGGGSGYILVSDQQANTFRIFNRTGPEESPHKHELIKVVDTSTRSSDGSDVTNASLGSLFPGGLFVAMSNNQIFHLYSWEDVAGDDLIIAPNGVPEQSMPE